MLSRRLEYQITGRDLSKSAFASAQASIAKTENRLNGLTATAGRIRGAFAAITLTGLGGGVALRDMGQIETGLIRLKGVSRDFASDQEFLIRTSKELGLRFSDLAKSFQDLAVLENIELLGEGQARGLAVGFEQAAKRFGVASTDIQLAVIGIRQALTQEVVRAQEFDQIFDAIGAVQPAVARQLGVTTQEFQKMRSSGTLLAADLVDALIPALEEFEGSAEAAAKSIEGANRRIGNAYEGVLLAFQEPVSTGFQSFADGVAGSLDVISNNADRITQTMSVAGTAVAVAFGARAVSSIAGLAAEQTKAITSSRAYSAAALENERRNVASAKAAASAAAIEQRRAQQRLFSLTSIQKQAKEQSRILGIESQIANQRQRLAVAQTAYTGALDRQNVSLARLSVAQRGASVSASALAVATRGVSSAMSLVGGPIGIAVTALGYIAIEARKVNAELRALQNANENLSSELAVRGDSALLDIQEKRLAAEVEINKLVDKRSKIQSGEIRNFEGFYTTANIEIEGLNVRINKLVDELESIELKENAYLNAKRTSDEFENLDVQVKNVKSSLDSIDVKEALFDKIFPKREQLQNLVELKTQLAAVKGEIPVSEYNEANRALQDQINSLNGVTKAREDAAKAQEKQLDKLKELRTGVLSETEKLKQEFADQENNIIEIQTRLGDKFVTDEEAAGLISKYREKLDAQIINLEDKRLEQEKRRIKEAADARDQAFQQYINKQQQNATATQTINPLEGIRARYDIERQLIDRALQNREIDLSDALLRQKALEITNAQETRDAVAEIYEKNPPSLAAFLQTDSGVDFAQNYSSQLLEALKSDVGQYINVQDSWTDAEKKRAQISNRINKKAFDDNKKFSISQAVIDGLVAVQKALAAYPPPYSYIAAGVSAAVAAKQIQKIKGTSFGSGSVSFGGTGASAGSLGTSNTSTQQSIQESNTNGGGTTVYFVTEVPANLENAIDNGWLMDNQKRNLKRMVDSGAVSSDAKIVVSDVPAPTLLRRNSNLAA